MTIGILGALGPSAVSTVGGLWVVRGLITLLILLTVVPVDDGDMVVWRVRSGWADQRPS